MTSGPPQVSDHEVQAFAFAVGKAIQNYGTIEYLVNELISFLVKDTLVASTFTQLGIAKRLDLVASLVARKDVALHAQGWSPGDLFTASKTAFRERNKIAHNPYVLREDRAVGAATVTVGIHVVRYHEKGVDEEWVDHARLEALTLSSRDLLVRFNQLLGCCRAAA